MNQTLTVNISGIVFHIEVDAYDTLKNYLNKIKSYFNNSEEREEIMLDIESRIAELFSGMMSEKNQVITASDVENVINVMGKPEQYITEDEEQSQSFSNETYVKSDKKLFRNPDDRILGGVCSGLGAYIGLDTVWVRLFFVAAFFLGFGLLTYIILWIVMPEAKTASDKLKMKGEPINIQNIGKKFEEEANKVSNNLKNVDTNKFTKKAGSVLENIVGALATIFTGIFNIVGKILGVAFLIVGTFMMVVLLGMLFGSKTIFSISSDGMFSFESQEFFNLIFVSQDQYYLAILGVLLVIGIPILTLIYLAIKLLFKIKMHYSVGLTMSILFVIGISICALVGIKMGTELSSDEEIVKTHHIGATQHTLMIKSPNELLPGKGILEDKVTSISIEEETLYMSDVRLEIEKSKTDSMILELKLSSNGSTSKEAIKNTRMINYNYQLTDSALVFDNYFSTLKENKIRGQQVELTLYIPLYQVVYLDESVKELIFDVDNVTNTYDKKMVRNKWIMLESGLTCLDCLDIKGITTTQLDSIKTYIPIK
ncbi:MAG: PspC domain-containing protein [Flavobacteriales bacterium]|nr:PspC domain-containing protein [Flavobacteriales bacterium]